MEKKIIIVTGATNGIGKATVMALLNKNYHFVLLNRSEEKANQLKNELLTISKDALIDLITCDLSSLLSVDKAADLILEKYNKVDILLNNAGAIFQYKELTIDGIEMTFSTNHLGHFHLTQKISDLLKRSGAARIINVSSAGHKVAKPDFSDINFDKRKYGPMKAYADSKLFNIYFTQSLAEKYKNNNITANSLHPGGVSTGFGQNFSGFLRFLISVWSQIAISPEKGAETSIFLVDSENVKNITGKYFSKKNVTDSSKLSYNIENRDRLWQVSEDLIKKVLSK